MWELKKYNFCNLKKLTIVTPSQWLADHVRNSYLREYPVCVINNGIDLDKFRPQSSQIKSMLGIINECHIILGVALGWTERKGLDVFIDLDKMLPDNYKIILVGTDEQTDKQLPDTILYIHRTQKRYELAELYSMADVFVNPTREENYPTVNMEALACGTPVLTFRTGGSPEIIDDTCGSVVDCDNIESLKKEIIRICEDKPYSVEQCVKKSNEFDQNERFKDYLNLYETIIATSNKKD
jgi:glycosyltransferase involved in cell wall biosynthesis